MERLIYSIVEERNYGGDIVGYNIAHNYKGIARVSKEEGDKIIRAIKKNGTFYKYDVNTTSNGELCWTFYFEFAKKLPEAKEVALYGHCPDCGSKAFIAVPRVPGTVFDYGEPDLMCKNCRRIVDGNDLLYGRYNK